MKFMDVTIKDVAKLANVATSTVSRVIANNPKISESTKNKVYEAMKELNYQPNAIARSLANKSTKTLGLILPNTDKDLFINSFFVQTMRGISHYAQKKGYYIMYAYSDNEDEEVEVIKKFISSKWVDGIILTTARSDDKCISYLKKGNHPFVVIGKPEDNDTLWVDNDNINAMYNVVNYLIKKGNRNIAFIGGPHELNVTRNRLEGYKIALEENDIDIDENKIIEESDFTELRGFEAMKKILSHTVPDAVVTTDDLIAFGVMKATKDIKDKNISIVGFNNTLLADYKTPSLTSVDINSEKLGYFAAKLLIDKLENKEIRTTNYIVDTELVERESTK